MGKTALILVAAFSVSVGLYGIGIQKANKNVQTSAAVHAYRAQAQEIAKSGVHLAVNAMRSPNINSYLKKGYKVGLLDKKLFDGMMDYIIDNYGLPPDYARITAVGEFKGHEATYAALVQLVGSGTVKGAPKERWKIVRTFENTPPVDIASSDDDEGKKGKK